MRQTQAPKLAARMRLYQSRASREAAALGRVSDGVPGDSTCRISSSDTVNLPRIANALPAWSALKQTLSKLGSAGARPASIAAMAAPHCRAWLNAAEADLGIAPAMHASPMTCTFCANCDSKLRGLIGHQPCPLARPASSAICPGA